MCPLVKAGATGALIVFLANGAGAARAQTPNKPAPPASKNTAPLIAAFERQVEANRDALKIPGLSIVVIQDGEVQSARGFGYADIEQCIPATPDTLYHIASLTKTFTADPGPATGGTRQARPRRARVAVLG
jgi:CubicO group peptidase (beta-lactamase class C family)